MRHPSGRGSGVAVSVALALGVLMWPLSDAMVAAAPRASEPPSPAGVEAVAAQDSAAQPQSLKLEPSGEIAIGTTHFQWGVSTIAPLTPVMDAVLDDSYIGWFSPDQFLGVFGQFTVWAFRDEVPGAAIDATISVRDSVAGELFSDSESVPAGSWGSASAHFIVPIDKSLLGAAQSTLEFRMTGTVTDNQGFSTYQEFTVRVLVLSSAKPVVRVERQTDVITRFPLAIPVTVTAAGGYQLHWHLYSGGDRIGGGVSGWLEPGTQTRIEISTKPDARGPFFVCAWAEDLRGVKSAAAPKSSCTWLSIPVPISRWANGCGTDGWGNVALWIQNAMGDTRVYGGEHTVSVRLACNVHDAAYGGVTIWDPFEHRYVDFRTWRRARIDAKFRDDIGARCRNGLTLPAELPYLPVCVDGFGLLRASAYFGVHGWRALQDKVGARLYYDLVREFGGVGFDADVTTPGTQLTVPTSTRPAGGARDNT